MAGLRRDQRGVVFPSPVVILSVLAVAMAAVAFVATRGSGPQQHEITTVSRHQDAQPTPSASATKPAKPKQHKPKLDRSKVYVEVFNNSRVTGLAAKVAAQASQVGWQVVGADNWYGTIPATTVYYPKKLERAAKQLALDLGIPRTAPAVDPMKLDRVTVILTGPLD